MGYGNDRDDRLTADERRVFEEAYCATWDATNKGNGGDWFAAMEAGQHAVDELRAERHDRERREDIPRLRNGSPVQTAQTVRNADESIRPR